MFTSVCQSLHRIVNSYGDIWSNVDLVNKQTNSSNNDEDDGDEPEEEDEEDTPAFLRGFRGKIRGEKVWQFPADVNDVLRFARSYFGERLQELHLHVVSNEIFEYLSLHCPNLKTLILHHESMALKNIDMALMPSQLQTLDLCMKGCFINNGCVLPSHTICRFATSPLKELRSLTVRYTECAVEFSLESRAYRRRYTTVPTLLRRLPLLTRLTNFKF